MKTMPNYTFLDKNTNKEFDVTMSISEHDKYLEENEHIIQIIKSVPLCDPTRVGVTTKPDDGFRDVLRNIKKNNPRSNVNTF